MSNLPELSSLIRGQEALVRAAKVSLGYGSNENVPNFVIYTPQESLQDEISSVGSVNMEDVWPDNRPNTSPFTTPIFYLMIGSSNVKYPIHQYFLEQSSELAVKCKSKPWGNKIRLLDVDNDDGHSLINYLYTGAYQTIKPAVGLDSTTDLEGSGQARKLDRLLEYKRSVRLYCTAKTYGLFRLEALCKIRIESFKDSISIWDTLDIAGDVYKKLPINDTQWFSVYLEGKMQAAINEDKDLLKRKKFLDSVGREVRFDKAMMKIIAHIYTGGNEPEQEDEEDEAGNETPK